MPHRTLPSAPDLDHLRNQAKALKRAYDAGDADALARMRAVVPAGGAVRLADAQLAIAREYGFPSWPKLKRHVETSRGVSAAVEAFMQAIASGRGEAAREIAEREPRIVSSSLHVAAVLGRDDEVRRIVAQDPARVHERTGPYATTPLLALCWSPFHGASAERDEGLFLAAEALLVAGADPNAEARFREGNQEYGIAGLYAVTGEREVPRIARLLLEAGARPDDGESVYHAAQHFHITSLELLREYGVDVNATGTWGNTPLYFLLKHYDDATDAKVRAGIDWLLAHGADPNVVCGTVRETSLHAAIRRRRSVDTIGQLLEHGADVNAARGDGRTAWRLAYQSGSREVVAVLEAAGARPEPPAPVDDLLAACVRGDATAAAKLGSAALVASLAEEDLQLLADSAANERDDVVRACLAAGFPVNHEGEFGGTALHYASIGGRSDLVREILPYGPDLFLRDRTHSSTPLGWAAYGADFARNPAGDYAGTVRLLLDAGAKLQPTDRRPTDPELAALLGAQH